MEILPGSPIMSDLYDDDVVTWSEKQAELLRRVAAGEPPNETPDWPSIIEEIESVGSDRLHSLRSWLRQALIHMLKAQAWPASRGRLSARSGRCRPTPTRRDRVISAWEMPTFVSKSRNP